MEKKRLGRTHLQVSEIGLGGIPLSRIPKDEAVGLIQRALELGINLIDTANVYFDSEEKIGQAIKGRRHEVILATKSQARDKKGLIEHLHLSLKRLGTDYIDIYQIHNLNNKEGLENIQAPQGALEGLLEAKRQGKIQHVGLSSHCVPFAASVLPTGLFDVVQVPFNYLEKQALEELLPQARKYDIGFLAMKPLGGAMLPEPLLAIRLFKDYPDAIALVGFEKKEEVEEMVTTVENSPPLSPFEREKLEKVSLEVGQEFCRRCEYCMPCPEGVKIPLVLTAQSITRRFKVADVAKSWIGSGIETGSLCQQCGECEPRCPYNLPIRKMLQQALESYGKITSRA